MTKAGKFWFLAVIMALLGLVEAITGFILWFGFPEGGGGIGRAVGGVRNLTLWGIPKYTWIDIHDWVAIALVVLVAIHIVLHWKWMLRVSGNLFRKTPDSLTPVVVKTNDNV
jgi:hypothetical protein